jgi:hypothetical protein
LAGLNQWHNRVQGGSFEDEYGFTSGFELPHEFRVQPDAIVEIIEAKELVLARWDSLNPEPAFGVGSGRP